MKKNILILVLAVITNLALAQHHQHRGHHSQRDQLEKMKAELSLNDEQYASIKSINEKYRDKRHALKADSTTSPATRSNDKKTLHKERLKEINSVLTQDQQTKWKAYKKNQAEARKAERQRIKTERTQRLKTELSLSDDQTKKIEKANQELHKKFKGLKKENRSKDDHALMAKQYREEYNAEIKTILSSEQYEKFQAIKKDLKRDRKSFKRH